MGGSTTNQQCMVESSHFQGFFLNSALSGLVSYNDHDLQSTSQLFLSKSLGLPSGGAVFAGDSISIF